jgi:hypothetical protein
LDSSDSVVAIGVDPGAAVDDVGASPACFECIQDVVNAYEKWNAGAYM